MFCSYSRVYHFAAFQCLCGPHCYLLSRHIQLFNCCGCKVQFRQYTHSYNKTINKEHPFFCGFCYMNFFEVLWFLARYILVVKHTRIALILEATMTNMVYASRSSWLVTIGFARDIWVGRAPGPWIRTAAVKEKERVWRGDWGVGRPPRNGFPGGWANPGPLD